MWPYVEIILFFGAFIFFMLSDLAFYYGYQSMHSIVPLIINIALTIVVTIISMMAAYETFHHRHDKDPW